MKKVYIGFALLLFGNIIANIISDAYLLTAIGLGIIGIILVIAGLCQKPAEKESSAALPEERESPSIERTKDNEKN